MKKMKTHSWAGLFFLVGLTFWGCGGAPRKIVVLDFAEGRVVDLSITEKLTGVNDYIFFSLPKKSQFLDGYIQGVVTDYADNPIQGVVVRAVASAEGQESQDQFDTGEKALAVSSFDPGVSDSNGFYRIRFSLPIVDGIVDVRGKLAYNPGWEEEKSNLGKAYEPQMKQSPFRLYYKEKTGMIVFAEGIRKVIVAPVQSLAGSTAAAPLPGTLPPASSPASPKKKKENAAPSAQSEDNLFKGFGFGP